MGVEMPMDRVRYPTDWKRIAMEVKDKAGWVCQCCGECGERHPARGCGARHGERVPGSSRRVMLTVAHLNHTPEDCRAENLLAMCAVCHLRYDKGHHAVSASHTRTSARVHPGQQTLDFGSDVGSE
jgi:hypothetical protein